MAFKKGNNPWNKGLTHKKDKRIPIKSKHPRWKGGRRMSNGYFLIKVPNHPNCKIDGYIYEHRLVMEKMIGRYLKQKEVVHHKNGNGLDNRPINLKLYSGSGKHIIKEHAKRNNLGRFIPQSRLLNIYIYINNINIGGN